MSNGSPDAIRNNGDVIESDRRRLLERHSSGDPDAFPELVNLYRRKVYAYLTRCGVEAGHIDDLFQEIFIKIDLAATTYSPTRPLGPWLFKIVANTVRSDYRKRRIRRIIYKSEPPERGDKSPDPQQMLEAGETEHWLELRIKKLPFKQREILVLCTMDGVGQKTVASILELPLSTVKTNLRRARMTLAKGLSRRKARMSSEVER